MEYHSPSRCDHSLDVGLFCGKCELEQGEGGGAGDIQCPYSYRNILTGQIFTRRSLHNLCNAEKDFHICLRLHSRYNFHIRKLI